ncbi:MAG: molecular chaperone DnaJ [Leptolyngbya sp.]|nr:MAG: molecular chaperone DnaJ [Leptolyngbya sp.]
MRIPLDYYRILGLPIQATNDQLRQAHRDRTLQLPRREYSDAAITVRKQLIDQAYAVLSDAEHRQRYDTSFLAKTYEFSPETDLLSAHAPSAYAGTTDTAEIDPHAPSIEIELPQFIGALLVLQELGEYELVLKLGRPFLTGGTASLKDGRYGEPAIVFSDIVLTVASACLELGREQWQQTQYENASEALETGQQLLLREGLFANVRGEIQSDLYRLRPYRVLELLAASEEMVDARSKGIGLLQAMLQDRGGIDGTNDDQSGLNVDDFLRFIQQIRAYLTAEEQQYLFEREANRPSAVATYLAVYALLARGFADHYPELVQRARQYLTRLSDRQDVNLEKAVCSLLLGQTEEASQALELSQEQDSIAFIRQHSQESPDLLPGLCLYTERWFQDEVFPHFRDLAQCQAVLKEYFADPHVQSYLEQLPEDAEGPKHRVPVHASKVAELSNRMVPDRIAVPTYAAMNGSQSVMDTPEPAANSDAYANWERETDHESLIAAAKARIASRSGTATLTPDLPNGSAMPIAERDSEEPMDGKQELPARPPEQVHRRGDSQRDRFTNRPRSGNGGSSNRNHPSDRFSLSPQFARWLLPGLALLGVVALGFLLSWLARGWQNNSKPVAQQQDEPLLVQLDKPLIDLGDRAIAPLTATTMDKESAQVVLSSWLAAKSKAMGSTYEIDQLDTILVDPSLSAWRTDAEDLKRNGEYRVYKHDVTVESVELLPTSLAPDSSTPRPQGSVPASNAINPSPAIGSSPSPIVNPTATDSPSPPPSGSAVANEAKVVADVKETTEIYRNGKVDGSPQTDNLRVQYNLVRKDGKWRIQDWQML